jgi:hypothetical protein
MGYDKFIDFANYNPTTWGNVGITVRTLSWCLEPNCWSLKAFLCATRTAYLLGLFGPDRKPLPVDKKGQWGEQRTVGQDT